MDQSYRGTGRRKSAVARVRLLPGQGKVTINDTPFEEYFVYEDLRQDAISPLKLTGNLDGFDVVATVKGGGYAGQAGALRLGIARALLEFNPDLRKTLKTSGLLTRDSRKKERYKYGLKKARKSPQFSKR